MKITITALHLKINAKYAVSNQMYFLETTGRKRIISREKIVIKAIKNRLRVLDCDLFSRISAEI